MAYFTRQICPLVRNDFIQSVQSIQFRKFTHVLLLTYLKDQMTSYIILTILLLFGKSVQELLKTDWICSC